jgi:spermidine/putrescine transport system permease protein
MGRVTWPGAAILGFVYFFLFAPAILVVVFSFNVSRFWAFPLKGFTLRWYNELLARSDAIDAVQNSFIVAVPTMIFAMFVGGAIGLAFHRWRFRFKGLTEGALLLPQLIPSLIWAIALLLFLTAVSFPMGAVSVIIGHTLFTAPYVILLVNARFHSLDPNLEDAARSLGARPERILRKIVLPHMAPALISGGLIAFAISFSDLIIAFFLTGGGFNTLPIYIYSLIQFEPTPMINAMASVVFAIALVVTLAALVIGGREAIAPGREVSDR